MLPPATAIAGTGVPAWPAPKDVLRRVHLAGLVPLPEERVEYHVHDQLYVFVNGQAVTVPAGIGINTQDPGVASFPSSSGVTIGLVAACQHACISPLHTHDASGLIHIEAPKREPFNLGQFFTEWGVRLNAACVAKYCRPDVPINVYVNGAAYTGNPARLPLTGAQKITIVIGTPPAHIPG
jgi:hypothetical protein